MRNLAKDKALCAAATPADKFPHNDHTQYVIVDKSDGFSCALTQQDVDFIAEARTALPYWMDQYEELEKSNEKTLKRLQEVFSENNSLLKENDDLKRRIRRLEEAYDDIDATRGL